jgi:hypothetical protein
MAWSPRVIRVPDIRAADRRLTKQNARSCHRIHSRVEKCGFAWVFIQDMTQNWAPRHQNYGIAGELMFPHTHSTGVHVPVVERHHRVDR